MEKGYYAILPANVRYDKSLTPNAKLLYAEITALTNDKGFCWATNGYFAELYSVSKQSISAWISNLKEKGYINITYKREKETSKVEKRLIYLTTPHQENLNPPSRNLEPPIKKSLIPPSRKLDGPHQENLKENNTFNNTFNNNINCSSEAEQHPKAKLIKEIIDYLNEKTNKSYTYKSNITKRLINARTEEGFTLEDFKIVIDKKTKDWNNPKMEKYLRPQTLFSTKFEAYLNEGVQDNGSHRSTKKNYHPNWNMGTIIE